VKASALMVAARQGRPETRSELPRRMAGGRVEGGAPSLVIATSLLFGVVAWGVSVAVGSNPLSCRGWLGARGAASWLLSLGLGLIVGTLTVAVTPLVVRRWRWARALHAALRPVTEGAGDGSLLAVAVATAVGEELFFRGLLVPLVGVLASSALFASLHQIRGHARWGWVLWAGIMGLIFATIFAATGSLAGPLVAHAAINHHNLRFLRRHNPAAPTRSLGGLLRR
jgi:membrane protease YdiL (CAAX protease family)